MKANLLIGPFLLGLLLCSCGQRRFVSETQLVSPQGANNSYASNDADASTSYEQSLKNQNNDNDTSTAKSRTPKDGNDGQQSANKKKKKNKKGSNAGNNNKNVRYEGGFRNQDGSINTSRDKGSVLGTVTQIIGGINSIISGRSLNGEGPIKCASRCGRGSGLLSMYDRWEGVAPELAAKPWDLAAPGKLVCLDESSVGWDGKGGALLAFDPENGCAEVAESVGSRGLEGCFHPDTKIRMANGHGKMIKQILPGERVWNPLTQQAQEVAEVVKGPEKTNLVVVHSQQFRSLVTTGHPFLTKRGLLRAEQLVVGDKIPAANGSWTTVEKLALHPKEAKQIVWNIRLKTNSKDPHQHLVLADGIVSGDLWLQKNLDKIKAASRATSTKIVKKTSQNEL